MSVECQVPEGVTAMMALPTMRSPGPHRMLGKHRRIRVVAHSHGVRVGLRRPYGRARLNSSSWVTLGDFSPEQAQRLVNSLVAIIDDLCDQLGLKPDGHPSSSIDGEEG